MMGGLSGRLSEPRFDYRATVGAAIAGNVQALCGDPLDFKSRFARKLATYFCQSRQK
jgi:hypothetical protein